MAGAEGSRQPRKEEEKGAAGARACDCGDGSLAISTVWGSGDGVRVLCGCWKRGALSRVRAANARRPSSLNVYRVYTRGIPFWLPVCVCSADTRFSRGITHHLAGLAATKTRRVYTRPGREPGTIRASRAPPAGLDPLTHAYLCRRGKSKGKVFQQLAPLVMTDSTVRSEAEPATPERGRRGVGAAGESVARSLVQSHCPRARVIASDGTNKSHGLSQSISQRKPV
jgi:hypothetical protein